MSQVVPAVAIREVTVRRGGRTVLDAVSMTCRSGEIIMLVGPNGAGKSTLLAALSRDVRIASGDIALYGSSITSFSTAELARKRAMYSTQESTRPGFAARAIVEFGRRSVPMSSRNEDQQAVANALRATESMAIAHRVFASLSEGERARIMLSRVFAQETPILLLDEPTAALDIRHQHLVFRHLRQLAQGGCTVIAAVHDLNLASMYADRIALLKGGRIVAFDDTTDVIRSDVLESVFDWPMIVVGHPTLGIPVVVPQLEPNGGAGE